ncbi:MAG: LysR family transcriptional regulator [Rhizobiaceae bacterium]
MDMRLFDFDWNKARSFLVTAEEGSLSAAARKLGLTQPTLGRQVSALEDELGVALFERVGRGLSLTKGGLELVEHVRKMSEAADRVSLTASGQSQSVQGTVRITATEVASAFVLPPIVKRLRASEPGISIEIVASNSIRDLRRREADIAIRSVRPTDPDLIARKLGTGRAHLYAAHGYVDQMGGLQAAEDFAAAEFIGFEENEQFLDALNDVGLNLTARNFAISTANHLVHWELVKSGAGIGVMVDSVGDSEPLVRRVATWLKPFEYEIWLVAHREVNTSRRVRLVFDRLVAELAN